MKNIFVFGSINMDLVISTQRMPLVGETFKGHDFIKNQGGKGANQAIACKKLGAQTVKFLGAVGNDEFGSELKSALGDFGVDVSLVKEHNDSKSGVCFIIWDESKNDNYLILDAGANDRVVFSDYKACLDKEASENDIFITQLEVDVEAVKEGLRYAKSKKMYTILNPAPAIKIGSDFLKNIDLIVLNETEAEYISDMPLRSDDDLYAICKYFVSQGVKEVIVTLGKEGSCYYDGNLFIKQEAKKVKAVDTTAAGDTFIGAIALKKAMGESIKDSLDFASICSAITVSRMGASISIPSQEEIKHFIDNEQKN